MVETGAVKNERGARLDTLDVLEGTQEKTSNAQNNNNREVEESDEEKPIIICGLVSNNLTNDELRKTELWRYLMVYLPPATQLPNDFLGAELLALGRRRDLPHRWKFQLAGGHPTVKTLCAVLVYLTGVPKSSPCETCANTDNPEATEGKPTANILPFPDCVGLPAAASFKFREYFGAGACCNLFYQSVPTKERSRCVSRFSLSSSDLGGTLPSDVTKSVAHEKDKSSGPQSPDKNSCDDGRHHNGDGSGSGSETSIAFSPTAARSSPGYKTALSARMAGRPKVVSIRKASRTAPVAKAKRQSSIRRLAAKLGAKAARREVAVYKPSGDVVAEEAEEDEKASQDTATEGSNGKRRSRRLLEQQREHPRPESKQSATSRASSGGGGSPSKPSKLRKKENKGSNTSPASSSKTSGHASDGGLREKPEAEPSQSLMMADWEIAPGRIRVGTGEDVDNIAFSSSYLAQGRAVPVVDGTTFQVIEIQPGGSLRWAAEESRTRLCSVARGIIRVKLPEREFPIGPNGMWKVAQGVACTVVNPFYLGAVVHVTIIGEEGL
ncbi:hypothetical protein NEMBOFW57_004796 [Staphylotrichum longicolle]|uniref:Uncharacterized protein n=1 Tax=Staphylotrichum longicolle TaxID=669026 RepID=A0AAD4EW37_9PEZI|nr:hypothetical protein NEMBOFW57_004796 [Staphylotrichum longicolle]